MEKLKTQFLFFDQYDELIFNDGYYGQTALKNQKRREEKMLKQKEKEKQALINKNSYFF